MTQTSTDQYIEANVTVFICLLLGQDLADRNPHWCAINNGKVTSNNEECLLVPWRKAVEVQEAFQGRKGASGV